MFRIGIDLGGTKIEGIVLNEAGKEQFRKRIATEQEHGYTHILSRIHSLYRDLANEVGAVHTFGIGTPGAISQKTGLLKNSNTVCLIGKPLKTDLEKLLGRPIAIENDANCFAMAEAILGAGKGNKLVFGVIMGTGCGGGIVYDGHVLTGLQSIGGEWGHMCIDPAGPLCYCGQKGCVETYISGGGVEKRYQEQFGTKKSFPDITAAYRAGDADAIQCVTDFFDRFGRAMANLINILDPDTVVLGGGVSNFAELYTSGIDAVKRYVFNDSLETPIVQHAIGDSAGVIGAALIGV